MELKLVSVNFLNLQLAKLWISDKASSLESENVMVYSVLRATVCLIQIKFTPVHKD
jgi:hypothetical protein